MCAAKSRSAVAAAATCVIFRRKNGGPLKMLVDQRFNQFHHHKPTTHLNCNFKFNRSSQFDALPLASLAATLTVLALARSATADSRFALASANPAGRARSARFARRLLYQQQCFALRALASLAVRFVSARRARPRLTLCCARAWGCALASRLRGPLGFARFASLTGPRARCRLASLAVQACAGAHCVTARGPAHGVCSCSVSASCVVRFAFSGASLRSSRWPLGGLAVLSFTFGQVPPGASSDASGRALEYLRGSSGVAPTLRRPLTAGTVHATRWP